MVPEFPFDVTCEADEEFNVDLAWSANDTYDQILIKRDGSTIATLPGDQLAYTDPDVPDGMYVYEVIGTVGAQEFDRRVPFQGLVPLLLGLGGAARAHIVGDDLFAAKDVQLVVHDRAVDASLAEQEVEKTDVPLAVQEGVNDL